MPIKLVLVVLAPIVFVFSGCVTSARQHDCFDFSAGHCVVFYERLSPEDRSSSTGKNLRSQICERADIKCVEEPGSHAFPLKLKMAKQNYADLSVQVGKDSVSGIFQKVESDSRHSKSVEALFEWESRIKNCKNGMLEACEKILTASDFGSGFSDFFHPVPKDIRDTARASVCKSSQYKCITLDHLKPYEIPSGWVSVIKSTNISYKDQKRTEQQVVIIKKKPL
jgi:hypothetical protein